MKNSILFFILMFSLLGANLNAQNIWEPTNGPQGLDLSTNIIATDSVIVLSAWYLGMYFSKDHGNSWSKVNKGLLRPDSYAYTMAIGPDGTIYGIIDEFLYRLDKNTDEWKKANEYNWGGFVVTINDSGVVYLINGPYPNNIAFSNDRGESVKLSWVPKDWHSIRSWIFKGNDNNFICISENGLDVLYRMSDDCSKINLIDSSSQYTINLVWHPSGKLFYYNPDKGLYKLDNQNNTKKIETFNVGANIQLVSIKPNGKMIAFCREGDFESDLNGDNWINRNSDLYKQIDYLDKLSFIGNEVYVHKGSCSGNELIKSTDEGISWISYDSDFSNPYMNTVSKDNANNLFSNTCQSSRYQYSQDKGLHWALIDPPSPDDFYYNLVSTSSGKLFTNTNSGLFKSTDFGKSWDTTSIIGFKDFAKLIGDNNKIICGLSYNDELYLSCDEGTSWQQITNPSGKFFLVNQIYLHPDSLLFFTSDNLIDSIFIFDIKNKTWKNTFSDFYSVNAFHISGKGTIFISGNSMNDYGLFESHDKLESIKHVSDSSFISIVSDNLENIYGLTDNFTCVKSEDMGRTWDIIQDGLPSERQYSNLIIDENGYLFIGLMNGVVYKTINSVANSTSIHEFKTNGIEIQPNPIESKLFVHFTNQLISSGNYKITNLNGTEKLTGEFHSNNFTIDCSALPNGMAFIQFHEKGKLSYVIKVIVNH